MPVKLVYIHLNGSTVGHVATRNVETLGGVAVRVDLVRRTGGRWRRVRATAVGEIPGTVEGSTGVGVGTVCTGVCKGIVDSG